MNNFELDKRAKELAASNSGYNLARRFLMLEDQLAEARREADQSHQAQCDPVGWQFYSNGEWFDGSEVQDTLDEIKSMGRKVRYVYAHPPDPAAVPENWKSLMYAAMDHAFDTRENKGKFSEGALVIDDTQLGVEFAMDMFDLWLDSTRVSVPDNRTIGDCSCDVDFIDHVCPDHDPAPADPQ